MQYTVRFNEVRMTKSVQTRCIKCSKLRTRVVSRSYYRNGWHTESETRDKYQAQIEKEAQELVKKGVVCNTCLNTNSKSEEFCIRDLRIGDRLVHYGDLFGIIRQIIPDGFKKKPYWVGIQTYHYPVDPITLKPKEPTISDHCSYKFETLMLNPESYNGKFKWVIVRDGKQIWPNPISAKSKSHHR